MIDWTKYRNFSRELDFADGDPRPELLDRLQAARDIAGHPFVITSGVRSAAANSVAGGVDASAHTRGFAVDISTPNSRRRHFVLKGLFAAGFHRMGIYETHVHADCDPSLPPEVCWYGRPKKKGSV